MMKKSSVAVIAALSVTLMGGVAPAHAASTVDADIENVVATQKGSLYTTSAVVKIKAPRKGSTLKVSTSFNPAGSVNATGKTQSKVIKAKWNKGGYYAATVKFTAKNVGKLSVSAKTSGKKVSAKHTFKLAPQVVSARSAQVGAGQIRSTFTLRVIAPKQGSTLKVSTSFNPAGSVNATGKTQSKVIKAKWNKGGYYAATVKFTAKNVGTFNFVARPMGTRVTLKKPASTSAVSTSLTVAGTSQETVTGDVKRTVTVSPAFGRVVQVQEKVNGSWKTISTSRTANAQKAQVTVSLPAPAAGKNRVYRVSAGKNTGVAGKQSGSVTLNRKAASTPPSTGGSNGGSTPDPTPSPTATPSPTDPSNEGYGCNALDMWGNATLSCDMPAYGYVLDRAIPGDQMGCGVSSVCRFTYEDPDFGSQKMWWKPSAPIAGGKTSILLAPDWLKYLNKWRQENGADPVEAFAVSESDYGYIADGQGGVAQVQAETILARLMEEGRTVTQSSDHIKAATLNAAWSQVTDKKITNCAENIVASDDLESFNDYVSVWAFSQGHRNTMLSQMVTHVAVGLARNEAGLTVGVMQVCEVPE